MTELYTIDTAVNSKEIGSVYPQAGLTLNYNKHANDSIRNLKSFELPKFEPNFHFFQLDNEALPTDLLSASMMQYGLMTSIKLKSFLHKFEIQESRFFDAPVHTSIEKLEYSWLHFGQTEILSYINFSKSKFWIYEFGSRKSVVSIDSYEHYKNIKSTISNMSNIKAESLVLNTPFMKDLFVIPYIDGQSYISKKMKLAIEKSKFTGIEIKPAKHIQILNEF